MNSGTINQLSTGELVVRHTYTNEHGEEVTQQLSIHPYFNTYYFKVNDTLNFEYSMECEIHYPKTCTCERVRLYALPIFEMTKQRRSFLKRVIQYFRDI
jgi:hypothetical protein